MQGPATVLVLCRIPNYGSFFKDRNGPTTWDEKMMGDILIILSPAGGIGITIDLFFRL